MIDVDKAATAVADLLVALRVEEDDHTRSTPGRVALALAEMLQGYDEDPLSYLKRQFSAPLDPGLIVVSGIRLTSTCAHHLLPITGTATVAYRPQPGYPIVGLSKLARVVHGYALRLQVQERIGHQVTTAVQEALKPLGSACVITAAHACMTMRGVGQLAALTTTQALAGEWTSGHPDVVTLLSAHSRSLP
ncbi:GTP cyclohydrolase I [Streptomyces lasiicapitis]|uniref:GTP cyclohydrolase I n=1 Tax=Streptomyces lasiicapitis TaxID=1923961 RepID=UPI0036B02585